MRTCCNRLMVFANCRSHVHPVHDAPEPVDARSARRYGGKPRAVDPVRAIRQGRRARGGRRRNAFGCSHGHCSARTNRRPRFPRTSAPAMPPKRKTQSVLRLFGILTRMRSCQFNSTRQAGRLLTALKKRGLIVRQGSDKCGIRALKSPGSDIAVTGARETHDI